MSLEEKINNWERDLVQKAYDETFVSYLEAGLHPSEAAEKADRVLMTLTRALMTGGA